MNNLNPFRRGAYVPCTVILLLLAICAISAPSVGAHDPEWPAFRGRGNSGITGDHPTPTTWDITTMENISWRTPLPGLAHSSPIISGDHIIVTTAVSSTEDPELKVGLYGSIDSVPSEPEHKWQVLALNRATGTTLWTTTVHTGLPSIRRHPKASHANSTPATDGKRIVAFFGPEGLYCLDLEGNILWEKQLGKLDSGYFRRPRAQWGFGSSPVIHQERVVVQCDVQGQSFIAVFDLDSGKEILRIPRDEIPTWSTPLVHRESDQTQIIVNGYRHIGGYDLETGASLWRLRGGGDIPVPSPIVSDGSVFITNAHGKSSPIYAISIAAKGDLILLANGESGKDVIWHHRRGGAYMQTPIAVNGLLYVCQDNGVLSCYRAATGSHVYSVRLSTKPNGFTASAIYGDHKLYYTSEIGEVYVVRAGERYELLSVNGLDEVCMATPAAAHGTLYFRTKGHLIAVGKPGS